MAEAQSNWFVDNSHNIIDIGPGLSSYTHKSHLFEDDGWS